ncbi:periplasmic binding protein-like I [Blastocladiella britannica]|nr:periplasmic binding protein-like I [Blastocladiella britannica]
MADMCAGSPVPPPLPPPRPSRMATQCHYHRHRPAAAFVWVTIVLLASSALVAAQSSSSAPAAPAVVDSIPYYAISLRSSASSSQDIHFGLQLPLAGSSLTTNADPTYWVARYAAQYGLERALANGLLPNANITLHVADTFHGTNPDATAARAADLLIAKGVVGVIGDGTSAQTIASAGIMSLYNIPICSPFASKDQLSNKKLYPSFYVRFQFT